MVLDELSFKNLVKLTSNMKIMKGVVAILVALLGALIVLLLPELSNEKEKFRLFLSSHPFYNSEHLSPSELKKFPKQDRPDLAWEQDYLRTLDPSLGRPAQERLEAIHDFVTTYNSTVTPAVPGSQSAPWVERGPNNVGGRTRALMWDPNDATGKKVWAGGVTGGLWYNDDITNANSSWNSVGNFWDNIAITCIASDPNNSSVFYVGTGEGWWTGSSRGGGIWKSTDGGLTWNRISSTTTFYFINDLVVRNESGTSVVYAAVSGGYYNGVWHGTSNSGLQRSSNGGSTWSQVLPTIPGTSINYVAADLELSASNRLWVGTTKSPFSATDRGGGRILYSDNGSTWTTSYSASGIVNGYGRVELATAPSNASYVYGIIENSNVVYEIVRTTNTGTTWASLNEPVDDDLGIPATDFSRGQAWYDLILAVDPSNPNKVIAGAINAHVSTNGGQSWSQISKWSNNSNMGSQPYSYIHADHHQILYKPGSANELIFGTDGGVFWTNSFSSATTSSVFSARNKGYNVTQFYAGAIHPTSGSNHMLAGSQDNGTQKFTSTGVNSTTTVTGGDGAFCFIDQTNANIQISSYVYNVFYRSTDGGNNFSTIQNDQSTGSFINPADYDDAFNVLFSARTTNTLNRIRNVETSPTIDFITIPGMSTMATHVRTSPYAIGSSIVYVGTGAGDLFKVTNASGTSPTSTSIGNSLPAGSISCVEIGASDNELLVTYSNYGVTSVWYTTNGGTTWVSKEGNLPDMPVRWALFNPLNRSEVILATEVGIWSTQNFNSASPTWTPSNSGLAHVRVDMLQIRDSDKRVMAITHGRGVFTSDGFNTSAPVANFGVSNRAPCIGQTVVLSDSTTGSPTSYAWTILPNTFSFVNGTNSSSASPSVQFNSVGSYTVRLTVSNAQGTDTLTQIVHAGGFGVPYVQNFEQGGQGWTAVNPDNSTTWSLYNVGTTSSPNWTAYVDNFNYNAAGQRDGLVSPAINLSGLSSATLSFSYAYRRYDALNQDSLAVFISTNCGTSWTRIASYKENGSGNFATGPDQSTAFFPTSSSGWCGSSPSCPTINLNAYIGNPNVRIKFENINGWGNNLFLDNIVVNGSAATAPVADFSVSDQAPCVGETVTLADSSSGNPTGYLWTITPSSYSFVNGTSAASLNPAIQFNSAGTYTLRLTVSNSLGSDTLTKYVHAGGYGLPYLENFALGGQGWTVSNPDNLTTWALYNVGTASSPNWTAYMDNYDYNAPGQRDGLISPPLNLTGLSSATLSFSHAYSRYNAQLQDSLAVFVSANCGSTWTRVASFKENGAGNFATGPDLTSEFIPTSSTGWCGTSPACAAISLNSFVGSANVLVKFENINGYGNNLYLDNISVNGVVAAAPVADFAASSTSPCIGQSVQFTDLTQGNPTSWNWSFSPNTVSFTNGTSAQSQNPQVSFSQAGTYQVTLVSANAYGTDSEVKSGYITVGNSVTPSVSITSNSTTLCSGALAVFTASPVNGGITPTYQWRVNGSNVGTNAATFSSSTLANGDQVSVELTSNAPCATSSTAVSNTINVSITQSVAPSVSITASTTSICAGSSVVFTATPVNGGSAPVYQWKINGSNVGGSSSVLSTSSLSNNDVVTVELTSSLSCVINTSALSNGIAVTVTPQVVPSVSITASANSVCAGTPIVFNAVASNGGTAPSYQWKVNGLNVGTNSAVYGSSTLSNNDVVMVEMTSNAGCVTSATAVSSPMVVSITQPVVPSLAIQATSTSICEGEQVQFTAIPTNGGSNPVYTWKVNGVNTGVSSSVFSTSTLNNNDLVSAEMASSQVCVTAPSVSSNVVSITVNALPNVQITNQVSSILCSEDTLDLVGSPMGGQYSSSSSGIIGQQFIPLLAGNGSHWIMYAVTGVGGCVGVDSLLVEVENIPVPTVTVSNDTVLTCNVPGYQYQWYYQNTLIPGATGQSYMVNSNGPYHVEISTQHCSSSSIPVQISTIGTERVSELEIEAYPNPTSHWMIVRANSGSSKSLSVNLYNSIGQLVWSSDWEISQGSNQRTIDVSSFAAGIYQLRVIDETNEVVKRIEVL